MDNDPINTTSDKQLHFNEHIILCFNKEILKKEGEKNGQRILIKSIQCWIKKVWFWEYMSNDMMKTKTWFTVEFMWMCFSYQYMINICKRFLTPSPPKKK